MKIESRAVTIAEMSQYPDNYLHMWLEMMFLSKH